MNSSKTTEIEFLEKIDLTYRGFKIGDATLINAQGDYAVEYIDKAKSNCEADYFLVESDILGISYHFDVSEVSIQKSTNSKTTDTCFYSFKENLVIEKGIRNILDTLTTSKE